MKTIFLFLLLITSACNKETPTTSCPDSQTQEDSSSSSTPDCTISDDSSSPGTTTGGTTTGGTTTGGTTTGGTTIGGTTTGGTTSKLPTAAFTFDTNIEFFNTTSADQDKFERAIEIIKKVVATEEFRYRILNHSYNGIKTFVDNGGYTNAQIYQMILDGAETLRPVKNNTMDMQVELYSAYTTTVGYTYPNTTKIWVNTKYFNTYAVNSVAANLTHEWLHKLGFKHAVSYSVSRDYSVPYAIGRIMSELGRQFL